MSKKEKTEARALKRKNRLIKKIIIWVVVLLGASALIFFAVNSGSDTAEDGGDTSIPQVTDDWVKWNQDSPVVLLEYSDFQCPACKSYFPLINAVGEEYGDRVAFVYRHYPISQIHFNANGAARAAEAAGIQGKFWEMHDRLFQTQDLWASMSPSDAAAVFAGYAKNIEGVNLDQYLADFESDEVKDRVAEDYTNAVKAGVNSTPTFYLNGARIKNPATIEGFRALLDEALLNAETDAQ